MVARRVREILVDAQIAFCGLNGRVPEGYLDLLEGSAAAMREFGKAAARGMGREPESHELAVVNEDQKDRLSRDGVS